MNDSRRKQLEELLRAGPPHVPGGFEAQKLIFGCLVGGISLAEILTRSERDQLEVVTFLARLDAIEYRAALRFLGHTVLHS